MTAAVEATGLVKRFGSVTAVENISFSAEAGTVLGVLGPNGAGKTTTVRMMTTLTEPDAGSASVAGFDVVAHAHEARASMGAVGQAATVDGLLTCRENLAMIAGFAGLSRDARRSRCDELIERFGLGGATDRRADALSGGMRRRLDLALSLMTRPRVLFLDEPTTGLDPRSRSELWEVLKELVRQGTTMLLTTQYLEEADQLADDILVIDHGRVVAHGDPSELKQRAGAPRLVFTMARADEVAQAADLIGSFLSLPQPVEASPITRKVTIPHGGIEDLGKVAALLSRVRLAVDDASMERPSLDEVFLQLTDPARSDGDTGGGQVGAGQGQRHDRDRDAALRGCLRD